MMKNCPVMPLLLILYGCGTAPLTPTRPATYPVNGRVLLNDRPLAGALIVLQPVASAPELAGVQAFARSTGDGSFSLSTFTPGDGVPAGKYAVLVILQDDQGETSKIPLRYAMPATSGLSAEIIAGNNPPLLLRLRSP